MYMCIDSSIDVSIVEASASSDTRMHVSQAGIPIGLTRLFPLHVSRLKGFCYDRCSPCSWSRCSRRRGYSSQVVVVGDACKNGRIISATRRSMLSLSICTFYCYACIKSITRVLIWHGCEDCAACTSHNVLGRLVSSSISLCNSSRIDVNVRIVGCSKG